MTDLQAELQAAADEMVATPAETGLQVAVHRYGQVIADVTAGVANPRTGEHVTPGTLFTPSRPRYAMSPASATAPMCSPPTFPRWAP
jgi:hypothetical protein